MRGSLLDDRNNNECNGVWPVEILPWVKIQGNLYSDKCALNEFAENMIVGD